MLSQSRNPDLERSVSIALPCHTDGPRTNRTNDTQCLLPHQPKQRDRAAPASNMSQQHPATTKTKGKRCAWVRRDASGSRYSCSLDRDGRASERSASSLCLCASLSAVVRRRPLWKLGSLCTRPTRIGRLASERAAHMRREIAASAGALDRNTKAETCLVADMDASRAFMTKTRQRASWLDLAAPLLAPMPSGSVKLADFAPSANHMRCARTVRHGVRKHHHILYLLRLFRTCLLAWAWKNYYRRHTQSHRMMCGWLLVASALERTLASTCRDSDMRHQPALDRSNLRTKY